ncbi:MAG: UDP-N-acetylmuramoyl-L-alanine--D-glutamate ligase [bacterium]
MKVLLLGLGRANLFVAKYLLERGIDTYLYEENMMGLSSDAKKLIKIGGIKEYRDIHYDLAICSPGFPESKPIIMHLRNLGVELIDETEFTYQHLKNPQIIAITGTNGKSTTAALISNILDAEGIKNFLGGNIAPGLPFSASLHHKPYAYYVVEMSSFQLMRIKKFHAHIALLTNISIDHLNWHYNLNNYILAKKRIFMNQTKDDYAILNFDDRNTRLIVPEINARIIYFGKKCYNGAWLNGMLHYFAEEIINAHEIPLLGIHNQLNTLAAIAATKALNISTRNIKKGIKTIKSLPHRLEEIAVIDGIRYINNSMSTNETSAIASFQAVPGSKIVIIGGREKGDRCQNYLKLLIKEAKYIIILGENANQILQFLKKKNYGNYTVVNNMEEAITAARRYARKGDTIMLNPGYASFGNFRDFQERGEAFRNGVLKH